MGNLPRERTLVRWSLKALLLWALLFTTLLTIMVGLAAGAAVTAWHFQDRWIYGLPCVAVIYLSLARVPEAFRILIDVFAEMPSAVRERRW